MLEAIVLVVGSVLVGLDACQAVTGRRIGRDPSRRADRATRIQSAVTANVIVALCLAIISGGFSS